MMTCAGRSRRSKPYTTSWRAHTMRARVSRSGTALRWRLEHARILQASRSDQGQAYEQEGMRRLPQNGRHLGAPPALSDVRARRMLRLLQEQARHQALPRDETPPRPVHRTRRGLDLVLRSEEHTSELQS